MTYQRIGLPSVAPPSHDKTFSNAMPLAEIHTTQRALIIHPMPGKYLIRIGGANYC